MDCTYLNVQLDLNTSRFRQNIHFYDSHFKSLHQPKFCGHIIDNRAYAPNYVLADYERESKKHLLKALQNALVNSAWWNKSTK